MHDEEALRTYVGFVWIGDDPAIRVSVLAADLTDAMAQLVTSYGAGHKVSLWNERDAAQPR